MHHPEVSRFLEANPELLSWFAQAYLARWDTYPSQLPDGAYTRSHSIRVDGTKAYHPLTMAHLERHLRGEQTLGAYILDCQQHNHPDCVGR